MPSLRPPAGTDSRRDHADFVFSAAARAAVEAADVPLSAAELVYRVNCAVDPRAQRILTAAELEQALIDNGYIAFVQSKDGQIAKTPTEKGAKAGVVRETYRLAGGGTAERCVLAPALQTFILDHLTELLLGRRVDELPAPPRTVRGDTSAAKRAAPPAAKPATKKTPAHFRFCWNCDGRIPSRYLFACPVCGWPVCPICGACRSPAAGGCPESKKGLSRYTGLEKEKNELRTLLVRFEIMDAATFADLKAVDSPASMAAFRAKHEAELERLDTIRGDKAQKKDPQAELRKEMMRNARGFYRIVSVTPRFLTYADAKGIKKTIPNRPPVRLGTEYADLSQIPEEER